MSTIKDEEPLYQSLKNLSWIYIYLKNMDIYISTNIWICIHYTYMYIFYLLYVFFIFIDCLIMSIPRLYGYIMVSAMIQRIVSSCSIEMQTRINTFNNGFISLLCLESLQLCRWYCRYVSLWMIWSLKLTIWLHIVYIYNIHIKMRFQCV